MKLTKEKLNQWIKEAMEEKGLLTDPEEELEEACGDGERGQRHHSKKDGRWVDPKKSDTCWAWKGCGRSRTKKGSKKRYAISDPQHSGRYPDRKRKCSTDTPIKEFLTRSRLIEIIREELAETIGSKARKTSAEKRATLERARRKKNKEAEKERVAPKHGIQDEIDDMNQWWKTLSNGVAESEERDDKEHLDKLYKDATDKRDRKKKIENFKEKYCEPCPPCKGATVGDIARNIDAVSRALKGKLSEPPKTQ